MRIVLANGVFDLLHPGHIAHLQECREMGDFLIVSLTLDEHVNKGPHRPIYRWEDRALLLRSLRMVDQIVPAAIGSDAILKWRPHIYVKGRDYTHTPIPEHVVEACRAVGAQIRYTTAPIMSASATILKVMKNDHPADVA